MSDRRISRSIGAGSVALAAALLTAPALAARGLPFESTEATVKAALIYNFAKFVEWPALPAGATLVACVVDDEPIAAALVDTVRGKSIAGHAIEVRRSPEVAAWRACHMLFVADGDKGSSSGGLAGVKTLAVLTVSDSKGFAQAGGIIEFFLENGQMRFAINVDAVERSGLHLSSRLLGLAKIVRGAVTSSPGN